jgi:hypothetical protein
LHVTLVKMHKSPHGFADIAVEHTLQQGVVPVSPHPFKTSGMANENTASNSPTIRRRICTFVLRNH